MTTLEAKDTPMLQPTHLLPEEVVHIMKRKHWFVLVEPLLVLFAIALFATAGTILTVFLLRFSTGTALFIFFLIILLTLSLTAKIIVDWLFNFYIITSHKITETRINPLFGDSISEILLKQIRCTEVDIINHGIVNQLLDKGDVHITFDRPTHKEEFVLSDIANPRQIGTYLSDVLIQPQRTTRGFWTRDTNEDGVSTYRYADELGPYAGIGGDI